MKTIEPCVLVIFGASGNLSRRKLIPALFRLEIARRLPDKMAILGCGLGLWNNDRWIEEVTGMLKSQFPEGIDEQAFERFRARLHYHPNPPATGDAYLKLQKLLEEMPGFSPNIVFYMAVRPSEFPAIIEKLGAIGLLQQKNGWCRVVIEKPFGYDLLSAQTLQGSLYRHLNEPQIYRIDHYLGKGTVQNVMVFRFANTIYCWNRYGTIIISTMCKSPIPKPWG